MILGATGAIGAAVAAELAGRGARLVLLGRDLGRLHALAASTGGATAPLTRIDAESVRDTLRAACAGTPIQGIAHCVGSLLLKPAHRTSGSEWHEVVETNLSSAFGVTMAAPELITAGGGVVFVSSVAAAVGLPNHEAIAAAKAGLEGLARAAAATHARRRIRFHCVAPSLVASRMTTNLLERPGVAAAAASQNPSGRIGRPEDVARAIAFLLDPASDWLNGQTIGVDGGFGSLRPH